MNYIIFALPLVAALAVAGCIGQASLFGSTTLPGPDAVSVIAYSKVVDASPRSTTLCSDAANTADTVIYVNNVPDYASLDTSRSTISYVPINFGGTVTGPVQSDRIPNGLYSNLVNAYAFGHTGTVSSVGDRCRILYHIVFNENLPNVQVEAQPVAGQPTNVANTPGQPVTYKGNEIVCWDGQVVIDAKNCVQNPNDVLGSFGHSISEAISNFVKAITSYFKG